MLCKLSVVRVLSTATAVCMHGLIFALAGPLALGQVIVASRRTATNNFASLLLRRIDRLPVSLPL